MQGRLQGPCQLFMKLWKVTPEISRIIMEDGNALQIAAASEKAGFNNLRRSGLKK